MLMHLLLPRWLVQEAQLSQTDRAMLRAIEYIPKSWNTRNLLITIVVCCTDDAKVEQEAGQLRRASFHSAVFLLH